MSITKPYRRIWRPMKGYDTISSAFTRDRRSLDYLRDERFANQAEMSLLVSTLRLMLHDLDQLFYYIEPHDVNLCAFSHRVYELYLRAATEFESNCKRILEENGYTKQSDLNMSDYAKLSPVARLPEYRVSFRRWTTRHEFKPFDEWKNTNARLSWYQEYNSVKHNRYDQFPKANLGNLMNAISAVLCILYAQWGEKMMIGYIQGLHCAPNNQEVLDLEDVIIYAPHFPETEQYDFIWDDLKGDPNPVQNYSF